MTNISCCINYLLHIVTFMWRKVWKPHELPIFLMTAHLILALWYFCQGALPPQTAKTLSYIWDSKPSFWIQIMFRWQIDETQINQIYLAPLYAFSRRNAVRLGWQPIIVLVFPNCFRINLMLAADLNGKAEQHWKKIEIYLHLRKVIPQDTDWEDCFFEIIKSLL